MEKVNCATFVFKTKEKADEFADVLVQEGICMVHDVEVLDKSVTFCKGAFENFETVESFLDRFLDALMPFDSFITINDDDDWNSFSVYTFRDNALYWSAGEILPASSTTILVRGTELLEKRGA